jgi:sulfate permease, SulP family
MVNLSPPPRQRSQRGTLKQFLPILAWLPQYSRQWWQTDIVAGLTTAAVVIPQTMAYAAIAGLPAQVGLYTALVPMPIYAILGTSRPLSVSTTSTIAILTASSLAFFESAPPEELLGIASALALMVGGFLLVGGILRLGFLANFISLPVLTGFKAGIGLVIFVGQLPKILGIAGGSGFFGTLTAVATGLPNMHPLTFAVGLGTIAILLGLPRFLPKIPAPVVAVILAIAISAVFQLQTQGVKLVGNIPPGFPAFALPHLQEILSIWPQALGIALMAVTESISAGRAFTQRGEQPPNANQELRALGMANLVGSLFQAMPSGGGASQTAVNDRSGAKTQMAELVTAIVVALTLLFLSPWLSLMPQSTLGGLVLVAAAGLVNIQGFRDIAKIHKPELAWAIVALVGVVVLGTLQGILVAIAVSLMTLLYQANHPLLYQLGRKPGTDVFRPLGEHPGDETFPGLSILRTEGRLTFASAPQVAHQMQVLISESLPRIILLDLSAVPDIEYTALQMLIDFEEKIRQQDGVLLWLARLNPEVLKVIRRSSLGKTLGEERLFFNVALAIEKFERMRI